MLMVPYKLNHFKKLYDRTNRLMIRVRLGKKEGLERSAGLPRSQVNGNETSELVRSNREEWGVLKVRNQFPGWV